MTTDVYFCPWCDKEHYSDLCVHVKEAEYTKQGHLKRVTFRDLADMPQEMRPLRYSLNDLFDSPAMLSGNQGQKDALEHLCRMVCDGEHSVRTFISLEQETDQDGQHIYRVKFAYKDRVLERVLRLSPRESPGPSGRIAHQLMPIDDFEFAAAPLYAGKEKAE